MQLLKQFSTNDLYSDNQSICNPSILLDDHLMIYRDGRNNPKHNRGIDDNSKLLKICNIDENLNVSNIKSITIGNNVLSDPKLFKWNGKPYIEATVVTLPKSGGYSCKIDIIDIEKNELLGISYAKAVPKEKNWVFFEIGKDLFCSYHLKNGQHRVLKLLGKNVVDYAVSNYQTKWLPVWGEIRNTSNFALYNGLLWGCFHSHTETSDFTYRMGIFAFEPVAPYRIKYMSNVTLFNIRFSGDIFYPSSLEVKDGNFMMGISFLDLYKIDVITISHDEIMKHLNENISYDYFGTTNKTQPISSITPPIDLSKLKLLKQLSLQRKNGNL